MKSTTSRVSFCEGGLLASLVCTPAHPLFQAFQVGLPITAQVVILQQQSSALPCTHAFTAQLSQVRYSGALGISSNSR